MVFLAHHAGLRGTNLLDNPWAALLDRPPAELRSLAGDASRLGYLTVVDPGGEVETDVSPLLAVPKR